MPLNICINHYKNALYKLLWIKNILTLILTCALSIYAGGSFSSMHTVCMRYRGKLFLYCAQKVAATSSLFSSTPLCPSTTNPSATQMRDLLPSQPQQSVVVCFNYWWQSIDIIYDRGWGCYWHSPLRIPLPTLGSAGVCLETDWYPTYFCLLSVFVPNINYLYIPLW